MKSGSTVNSRNRGLHRFGMSLVATAALNLGCNRTDSARDSYDSSVAVAVAPTVVAGTEAGSRSCPAEGDAALVSAKGIGAARLGMPISDLKKICIVRDSALRAEEGQPANAYAISVGGGRASLLIFIDEATQMIRHVASTDTVFRSSGGIGVGSTVGDLRQSHGRLCGGLGPAGIEVWPASLPGVVIGTTAYPPKMPGSGTGLARDASAVPDSARLTSLAVSTAVRPCS
ncbi:MAG: hypothetical protein H0T48_00930 [Gemmatimonadaceae bacterium]|nr:hypothetical protein [Gemmatimonadaceae bacterium]